MKRLASISLFFLSAGVAFGILGFLEQTQVLFAPVGFQGTNQMALLASDSNDRSLQTIYGPRLDAGSAGSGVYEEIGTNLSTGTVEWTQWQDSVYSGAGGNHVGIGMLYTNSQNWGNLVMQEPNAGTTFIGYRYLNGLEVKTNIAVSPNPALFQRLRFKSEMTNGNIATVNQWIINHSDGTETQIVTNESFAPTNALTGGHQFVHTYGSKGTILSLKITDGNGGVVLQGPPIWQDMASITHPECTQIEKSKAILHSDSSLRGPNTYSMPVSSLFVVDGTLSGYIHRQSGRGIGICRFNPTTYRGDYIWYDNSNLRFQHNVIPGATLMATSSAVTLTTNAPYFFTMSFRGTNGQFKCNGVTLNCTLTNSSGFIGIMGFQSVGAHDTYLLTRH